LRDNPWLAGFLEADGYFYCGFNLNSEGIAEIVKNYMSLVQKQIYKTDSNIPKENNSNFQIMNKIKEFLEVKNVNEIKRIKTNYIELSYEVRTSKKSSCDILINYLSVYPLFSSKYQDFLNWREFHRIRLSKEYGFFIYNKRCKIIMTGGICIWINNNSLSFWCLYFGKFKKYKFFKKTCNF